MDLTILSLADEVNWKITTLIWSSFYGNNKNNMNIWQNRERLSTFVSFKAFNLSK